MKITTTAFVLTATLVSASALAVYGVIDRGTWPTSWPSGLERFRKQSRSLEHMDSRSRHYAIRFSAPGELRAAWPSLMKVKTKGAPVILVRGTNFFLGEHAKAGVVVHCPPIGHPGNPAPPQIPIPGETDPRAKWRNTVYVEVVVDDRIVKWEGISVPDGTIVIDERRGRSHAMNRPTASVDSYGAAR